MAPDRAGDVRGRAGGGVQGREERHRHAPGGHQTDQHGDAGPEPDEVADADQGERYAEVEPRHRAAEARIGGDVGDEDA